MVTQRKAAERIARAPLRTYARAMRHDPTDAEKKFWRIVRDRRLGGHKFRRQLPIGRYIVDFVCIEQELIIELDGGQHGVRTGYDAERDAFLTAQGFRVVRFWNTEVLKEAAYVVETILQLLCRGEAPSPQPSPPLRGGDGAKK